jgi:undecaprenyl-diphosphatase
MPRLFLLVSTLLFFVGLCFMVVSGYAGSFRWLNSCCHSKTADYFFGIITQAGDGLIAAGYILLILSMRYPNRAVAGGLAILVSGIAVQLLKNFCFYYWPRPAGWPELAVSLHLVNEHAAVSHSFPSGHATTAYAAMTTLAYKQTSIIIALVCAIIAAIAALSRVYLGVHFLGDIIAGSILGMISALIINYWMEKQRKLTFLCIYLLGLGAILFSVGILLRYF